MIQTVLFLVKTAIDTMGILLLLCQKPNGNIRCQKAVDLDRTVLAKKNLATTMMRFLEKRKRT